MREIKNLHSTHSVGDTCDIYSLRCTKEDGIPASNLKLVIKKVRMHPKDA